MRKRKLLPLAILADLQAQIDKGLPLNKLVKPELDMSRAAVSTLLKAYKDIESYTVRASLAPTWVNQDATTAQEQPDNLVYLGKFPHGEWYEIN